jgi:transposase
MSKPRSAYPPEFRRQMVELVRSGRNPEELSREFEPTGAGDPQLGGAGRPR